jgi:8-oxo-dGTP pyrophosphatase MutT (NUDIX family)
MKLFKTIRDQDFGLDTPPSTEKRERRASRVIVFDEERNVAILKVAKRGFHKLPGGGIDEGESIVDALRRETIEEVGCELANIEELGMVEEFRDKFGLHQISYCFVGDVIGEKKPPKFEPGEIADGMVPVWLKLDEAIATLAAETDVQDYEGKFIQVRDLTLLEEAKKYLEIASQ